MSTNCSRFASTITKPGYGMGRRVEGRPRWRIQKRISCCIVVTCTCLEQRLYRNIVTGSPRPSPRGGRDEDVLWELPPSDGFRERALLWLVPIRYVTSTVATDLAQFRRVPSLAK